METPCIIPYAPRPLQWRFHQQRTRFCVLLCHRRFGKTVAAVNDLLRAALRTSRTDWRAAYAAPYLGQAKAVAWDYLRHFAGVIPGTRFHEGELRCDLPNGARIRLYGTDNAQALRGLYLDDLVLDEPAAGLDPEGRDTILSQIRDYHEKTGITVLLVSHSMEDIAKYANRVLVMSHAKLAMYDTVEKVFGHAQELLELGLSVPQVTQIFLKLRQMGLDIPTDVYTMPYAVKTIQKALAARQAKGVQ